MSHITPYTKSGDNQSDDWGLGIATLNYHTTLVQNVAQSVTVPGGYDCLGMSSSVSKKFFYAIFTIKSDAFVLVNPNGTATVPTGSVVASESEAVRNGMCRFISNGQVLSFITPDAAGSYLSVAFYPVAQSL